MPFFSSDVRPIHTATQATICPDQLITARLDEVIREMHRAESLRMLNRGVTAEFPWLPGYMIKLSAENRIAGAQKLQSCIQEKGLDLLLLPKQTRFEIPERYHDMTKLRSLCIAEKIEGYIGRERSINLRQAKQLVTLILETGLADPKCANLVHLDDEKIAIIDTESLDNTYSGLDYLYMANTCDKDAEAYILDHHAAEAAANWRRAAKS